ncbi:unnamed protein product [Rotaria sp. Silwood2]|nr:unnamed protein product [Rotaria sp. Silwood2]CAF4586499.1 unnamed protein product [Rotaria sp. Silwood2]
MTERCSTVLNEIKQFADGEDLLKPISLEDLDGKERNQIYNFIETEYCNRIEFEKKSSNYGKNKQVVLMLTKITGKKEVKKAPVQIDDTIVHFFYTHNKLPIAIVNHKFLDYYLDCLDPYFDCRATFAQFLEDIETHETVGKLISHINQIQESILNYISTHPSMKQFQNTRFQQEIDFIKSGIYKTHCTLYTKENHNKLFISVDIIKANYTILNHYHPEIFRNSTSWSDFVNLFCGEKPIHTLLNSKYWRERTLGQAGITPKTNKLAEYFVRKILHEMQTPATDVVLLNNDEVVLQYDPLVLRRLMDNYHGTFFKVIPFRLIKLPQYNYFVKEYFNPPQSVDNDQIAITRCEFKCIPLPFFMQCVKKYEDKPITEIDRKFTIESGHVATLDVSIF